MTEATPQQLFYTPPSYEQLNQSKLGRWQTAEESGGRFLVWTDDEDGAGVLWEQNGPQAEEVWRNIQLARLAGVSATLAYELAIKKLKTPVGEEGSGLLANAILSSETE